MKPCICYFGDDELSGPAAYLAGVMGYCGFAYDHIPSRKPVPNDVLDIPYALYVISDYPSAGFSVAQLERLVEHVERGSGLLMIGGWESYFGRVGEYINRPIARALPVYLMFSDDRVNCPQGCVARLAKRHPVTDGLPWEHPPIVIGFNRVVPKPESLVLLTAERLAIADVDGQCVFEIAEQSPLLVVGKYGGGRTAALACDVAPHWVGGLVDWGQRRIVQQIPSGGYVEVGDAYVRFLGQLLAWAGRLRELPDAYPEEAKASEESQPGEPVIEMRTGPAGV